MISVGLVLVQLLLASIAVQDAMTSPSQFALAGSESPQSVIEPEVSYDGGQTEAAELERLVDILKIYALLRPVHAKRRILDLDALYDGRRKRNVPSWTDQIRTDTAHDGRRKRNEPSWTDHIRTDALPDGRRKRHTPSWVDEIRTDRAHDGRRRKRSSYKKSLAVYSNLRPLIAPDIIHMGRRSAGYASVARKRFLDTVGGGHIQPLEGRRRKRLLDTLVRARPIFDGKRG